MSKGTYNPLDILVYLALFALGFTVGALDSVRSIIDFNQYAPLIIGIVGTFSVTFLGIYASNLYSVKLEDEKNTRQKHNYYKSALILISSELDFNEKILSHLVAGMEAMPKLLKNYYSQFSFLIEVAKPIKSKAFYSTYYTQSVHELIDNLDLFNTIQQAYFNTALSINGLYLTQDAHSEYQMNPDMPITVDMIDNSKRMIEADKDKIKRAIGLVNLAKKKADAELRKYGLNFSDDNSTNI